MLSTIRHRANVWLLALVMGLAPLAVQAQQDAEGSAPTFKEGDIITAENVDALRPYLPEEFWDNRDFFFHDGMQLEIGPFYRDYSQSDQYKAMTEKYKGQPKIGPDNSHENYVAGQPFRWEETN